MLCTVLGLAGCATADEATWRPATAAHDSCFIRDYRWSRLPAEPPGAAAMLAQLDRRHDAGERWWFSHPSGALRLCLQADPSPDGGHDPCFATTIDFVRSGAGWIAERGADGAIAEAELVCLIH